MVFKHGENFFAKDNECLRVVDMGKRMEVTVGIKSAISNEAVNVRMPGEKIAKSLDRGDETGFI